MQPRTLCLILLVPLVAALAGGCPAGSGGTAATDGGASTAPADTPQAPPAGTGPAETTPAVEETPAGDAVQDAPPEDSADEAATGDEQLPDMAWQLAGFRLGMTVAEAREQLPARQDIPVQEQWKSEEYTGMIVIGTYAEPVQRMSSVLFYEGHVAAVIDSVRCFFAES